MIDTPDAPEPRFPESAERRVAAAIAAQLDAWGIESGDVAITQGARGADLMIAEAALARGAEVEVLLPAPPAEFLGSSVELTNTDWAGRFRAVLSRSRVRIQADELGPVPEGNDKYTRNNTWSLDVAAATASAATGGTSLYVLAVQSRRGARRGGAADFVNQAKARGLAVTVVDPTRGFRYDQATSRQREDRADGPKRLLALDGGGMRGLITLQILRRVEEVLGNGDPAYRLSSTFDYIAGTSTGAIIAAALAVGHRVETVEELYRRLGPEVFRRRWFPGWYKSMYRSGEITDLLKEFFGAATTLGDPSIRTLLMAVTHRTDTDSLWALNNVSTARYNDSARPDSNLGLPLWQIIRGSSAAPVFFPPEEITIGDKPALFQDGGVTPFNNPALLLFEMATSPRYTLGWPTGPDRLLIVSVGTGSAPAVSRELQRRKINLFFHARTIIRVFMNGSSTENDRLCQVLGHTRHAPIIDREFNADSVQHVQPDQPLFSYIRYNAAIGTDDLAKVPDLAGLDAKRVAKLDAARPDDIDSLLRIGRQAAGQVQLVHFAGFLP